MDNSENEQLPDEELTVEEQPATDAEYGRAYKREMRKIHAKNRFQGILSVVAIFVVFFAFVGIIIATGNTPESNFYIMLGAACVFALVAVCSVAVLIYNLRHHKEIGRAVGIAVLGITLGIIFSAIVLCWYLPPDRVMLTAFMLIACYGLIFSVTYLLRLFDVIGKGNFAKLSAGSKKRVVIVYVLEGIMVVGALLGGVFGLIYVSIPCIMVGVIAFWILMGPVIFGGADRKKKDD